MPQLMLQLLTIQLEPLSLFPHVTTTLHTPMKIRKCEIIKLRPRSRLQNKSNCTHLLGDCKLSSVYVLHFFLPGTELAPRQRYKSDDHPVSLHSQPLLQRGNGHVALLNGTWAEEHMNSQVTALGKKKQISVHSILPPQPSTFLQVGCRSGLHSQLYPAGEENPVSDARANGRTRLGFWTTSIPVVLKL